MRSDDHFLNADLNPVIGQTAAVLAAGHDPFHHVIRAVRELFMAEFDLSRADDHFADIAGRYALWRRRY